MEAITVAGRIGAITLAALLALALVPAAQAEVRHVDCQANPAGADGSIENPWNALDEAVATPLTPGDQLLLRAGTTCEGALEIADSGTASQPITVSAYGDGAPPAVVGEAEDAVTLRNTSHLELRGLDVSNPGDGSSRKRGVHLVAEGETVTGLKISDNHIHDVGGDLAKDGGGSGGIQVDATGPGVGRFADLRIEGNEIERVSRSGIFIVGLSAGERPRASEPWPNASSGVRVTGNRLDSIAGDGIVTLGTDGAVLASNEVSRGNLAGRPIGDPQGMICNAGIWAFNANNTLIEGNEVSAMEFNGCDGSGFDVDYMQDGTVIQHNLSHDNEGGFLLLCTDSEPRLATVRFNLSVNDDLMFNSSPCSRPTGNYDGIGIYNNTIVAPDPAFAVLGNRRQTLFASASPRLTFFNNIVVATAPATGFTCEPECSHNLFSGLPAAGKEAITGDPGFVGGPVGQADSYKLASGSIAFDAGMPLPEAGLDDFFGRAITESEAPNLGMDQAPAPTPPPIRPPVLKSLSVTPKRLKTGRKGRTVSLRRKARIRIRLDRPARVYFILKKRTKHGARRLGGFNLKAPAGKSSRRFLGAVARKRLGPGRYLLVATPTAGGEEGKPRTARFWVA